MRPIYKDTEVHIGPKLPFSGWGEVYKRFHDEEYLDVIRPSDSKMRGGNDLVFINIGKSHLHSVATRTTIVPCSYALDWTISHANMEHRTILNEEGICIGSYLPSKLEKYDNLFQLEVHMIIGFVEQFNKECDTKNILSSWWVEDKRFFRNQMVYMQSVT
jgi:hypothetical protein